MDKVFIVFTGTEVGDDDGYHIELEIDTIYDNREAAEWHASKRWLGEVREYTVSSEVSNWLREAYETA